jgi:glutathione S-transferase
MALSDSITWPKLEKELLSTDNTKPISIDSVLDPSTPDFSTERPTLFRERHGWCPYSERVWLAMELAGTEYDTIRIDNTGHGPRPSYFSGQTPQVKWPNGKVQGESMDLVKEVDERYAKGSLLSNDPGIQECIRQFSSIFPRARPSSRAAYLFQYSGEPIWKSTFEETLQKVNDLLLSEDHSFMGNQPNPTAADICYAPFLERYRYQLPCLHPGLDPTDATKYPQLAMWYKAMDHLPVYACRVKGDAASWRKVLTMAGFGNAGVPSSIQQNIQERIAHERSEAEACIDPIVWKNYRRDMPMMPYSVPKSPYFDAATIITQNRKAIVKDATKGLDLPEAEIDAALLGMVARLVQYEENTNQVPLYIEEEEEQTAEHVAELAEYLDHRMCVPRDMGAMSAAVIKTMAVVMRQVLPA